MQNMYCRVVFQDILATQEIEAALERFGELTR